jgi:hypothetical protein
MFFYYCCLMMEGSGPGAVRISEYWIRIQGVQKHMDPPDSDPDPQHWLAG